MTRSMTGFGRGEATENGKTFVVEVRTVNHRYNDISIRMPRIFNSLEDKIREYTQNYVSRGKIDIYISYNTLGSENKNVVFDGQLADEYVNILGTIKNRFNLDDNISLSMISRFPDIVKVESKEEDQEEIWDIMKKALEKSFANLVKMRESEGERLKEDILKRLEYIKNIVKSIEERSPVVVEEYRQKLENRIKDLLGNITVDETRLATEVAIMADRSSITEEIVRLYSHINEMQSTFKSSNSIGRKLDFIVQEMNRETNTINSKASDTFIINNAVEIKSEIEKIREQIQNIE